ncbi:MAG: VWA domain-containing protein [Gaiellaceae bacterium MAG52_C11]|nr:VWA domain-containing protein [Candidatus Gaiellasilicea maunaloa]
MGVSFLTPWAAAVGVLALLGVGALVASERRSRRLCAVLGLEPRPTGMLGLEAAALVAIGLLLGLGAAQPVVSRVQETEGRTDVEAIAVLDVSRSMLARPSRSAPARIERARAFAKELRFGLVEVPVGVASVTDRLLPHLFPTLSATAFTAIVDRAVEIDRPPPERRASRATALAALGDLGRQNFFGSRARVRVAVVFTDGESVPFNLGELRSLLLRGRVATYFVHVWHPEDRVYGRRGEVESYRPDSTSRDLLERVAREIGGRVFSERELPAALAAVRGRLGEGAVAPSGRELRAVPLAPYAVAVAALPLALLLLRRNF